MIWFSCLSLVISVIELLFWHKTNIVVTVGDDRKKGVKMIRPLMKIQHQRGKSVFQQMVCL